MEWHTRLTQNQNFVGSNPMWSIFAGMSQLAEETGSNPVLYEFESHFLHAPCPRRYWGIVLYTMTRGSTPWGRIAVVSLFLLLVKEKQPFSVSESLAIGEESTVSPRHLCRSLL